MSVARRVAILTWTACLAAMGGIAWVIWLFWPSLVVLATGNRIQHTYYIPSESMLPTLEVNDRVMPLTIDREGLKRGDIVVFHGPDSDRVARVAGVGGDMIGMRDGIVNLNGRLIRQRILGPGPTGADGEPTHMLAEQFPGEGHEHRILDMGFGETDTVASVPVAAGTVYLLGDNRDRAADSRVPIDVGGVGEIPIARVLGVVDRVYWSKDRSRIGVPIDSLPIGRTAGR